MVAVDLRDQVVGFGVDVGLERLVAVLGDVGRDAAHDVVVDERPDRLG